MVIGCLRPSDVSVICRVVNPRRTSQKTWEVSCTESCYVPLGNDFELIPMVEIETRNPIERYPGSEFPAMCNHCWVMAAWNSKTLKYLKKFLLFRKNDSLREGKFSKICSEIIYRDTDRRAVFKFVKLGWREIGEIVRCLPDKKKQNFAWLSSCCYSARLSPKICQGQHPAM